MTSAFRFRTAWAQLRYAPGRFASTVLAIALAVGLASSVLLVSDRIVSVMEASIEAVVGRADLQIVAMSPVGLEEDLVARIAADPGVAVAAPVINVPSYLDDDVTQPVTVWGLDLMNEGALELYGMRSGLEVALGDPMVFMSQPDSVIVTRALLDEKGLHEGDTMSVATPAGPRRLVVRGVVNEHRAARIGGAVLLLMDVYSAQTTFAYEGRVSHIDVLVTEGHEANEVAKRLSAIVGEKGRVETGAKRQAGLQQLLAGFRVVFVAFSLSGLALAILVTFSRASAVFAARQWELALTRALGASPRIVQREVLKELLLVGTLGSMCGIPLGVWMATVIAPNLTEAAGFVAGVNLPRIDVSVRLGALLTAAAFGIAGTIAGGLVPARRAARAPIASVMSARGIVGLPQANVSHLGRLIWVLLLGVGMLVWLEPRTQTGGAGFIALALLVLLACLLVQPTIRFVLPLVTWLFDAAFGAVGRLAALHIRHSLHRSTAIARLFAVGLGFVVWFATIGRSFEESLCREMGAPRRADLMVGSAFDVGGDMTALGADAVDALRAIPGVEALSAERSLYGAEFGLTALDAAHFLEPRFAVWDFEGTPLDHALQRVAVGEAIIVTPGFAAHHHVGAGDRVTLSTPSGPLNLPVAAIAPFSVFSSKGDVAITRDLYRRYWKDSAITRVHLLVARGASIDSVRREIYRTLGASRPVRVLSAAELAEYFASHVRGSVVLVQAMSIFILLVVVLGIADAVLVDVLERTREIGTMRALGASPRSVGRLIVLEVVVTSVIGSMMALAMGYVLSVVLLRTAMPSILGWSQRVTFDATTCMIAAGLAILAALTGGFGPALRVTRIAPAVALRQD